MAYQPSACNLAIAFEQMATSPTDLSFEDCETWMRELGLVTEDNKPDWGKLVSDAGIGSTQQYVVKNRWGSNDMQMAKIVKALEERESKRKKPTATKERLAALEEWDRIGRVLVQMPEQLRAVVDEIRPRVEGVEKMIRSQQLADEGKALLASPFSEPRKSRK